MAAPTHSDFCTEHANSVLSRGSAILAAAEEQLHDVALSGKARAGLAEGRNRDWTINTAAICVGKQPVYSYRHLLTQRRLEGCRSRQ